MANNQEATRMLQAEVDEGKHDSCLRLLHHDKVKYLTIASGLYDPHDMCFAPAIIPLLPPFPPGDWNDGTITRNPANGAPHFSRAVRMQFAGVKNAWHPLKVDHLSLTYERGMLCSGVYKATHPDFLNSTVIAKFAVWPWEIGYREQECTAYQCIEGRNIGPKFQGLIVEEGRVIGFILECIDNARHATPSVGDLKVCREKLGRLHGLGILHGDVNKHNFLITADGEVTIIDFESAKKCDDPVEFEKEVDSLERQFNDVSGRGGQYVVMPADAEPGELEPVVREFQG